MKNYRIDPNDIKYTNSFSSSILAQGSINLNCENALLLCMFDHFPDLELKPESRSYDLFRSIFDHCSLKEYLLSVLEGHQDHTTTTTIKTQYEKFFTAINALRHRGLVEVEVYLRSHPKTREVYEIGKITPNKVLKHYKDQSKLLELNPAYNADVMAREFHQRRGFCIDNIEGLYFEYIRVFFTSKGYDVALKFREHNDNTDRFDQQKEISKSASGSAASSAKTAKRALWAAGAIAAGSLLNVTIAAIVHWDKLTSLFGL